MKVKPAEKAQFIISTRVFGKEKNGLVIMVHSSIMLWDVIWTWQSAIQIKMDLFMD